MKSGREHPAILLPLGAALLAHALVKQDFILPPLALIAMIAGYWLPTPSWWRGRRPLYLAAVILAGPAYLYQRLLLPPGVFLYIFFPWMVDTAAVLAALLLVLVWYLPPGRDRLWGLSLLSFALIALSGNLQSPFVFLHKFDPGWILSGLLQGHREPAYLYLPCTALYLLCLLIFFKSAPRPRRKSSPRPDLYAATVYGLFLAAALVLSAVMVSALSRSDAAFLALSAEMERLYSGPSSIRLPSTWQSGSVTGWEGSDEPVMTLRGAGPLPDHLRLQVWYRYQKGTWTEGGKDAPVLHDPAAGPLVLAPESAPRWDYRALGEGLALQWLPLPQGAQRVSAEFPLNYYPASALIDPAPAAKALEPREFALAGADAPLPACGDTCVRDALEVPANVRAAIRDQALAITAGAATDRARAEAVVRHFAHYSYSLEPQNRKGPDPVIAFLAEDNAAGLCRDFAEAAVLILRAVDVPARAVSGILLEGAPGSGASTLYVMRRDFHMWIEVYCREQNQWVQFDPTPANSRDSALGLDRKFMNLWRHQWDRIRIFFRHLADLIRRITLADLLARLTPSNIALGLGAVILILMLIYLVRARRTRRKKPPAPRRLPRRASPAEPGPMADLTALYLRFLARLAERGVAVALPDTGADVLQKIRAANPAAGLPEPACAEFIARFNDARYRRADPARIASARAELARILARC